MAQYAITELQTPIRNVLVVWLDSGNLFRAYIDVEEEELIQEGSGVLVYCQILTEGDNEKSFVEIPYHKGKIYYENMRYTKPTQEELVLAYSILQWYDPQK